jgi:hypothetical protein
MDFFTSLFTITSDAPEPEPSPSTPIDAGGSNTHGKGGGCIVAYKVLFLTVVAKYSHNANLMTFGKRSCGHVPSKSLFLVSNPCA